jgi:hypothetical protein
MNDQTETECVPAVECVTAVIAAITHPENKPYGLGLARRGESGYYPLDSYFYASYEEAERAAKHWNEKLGVSEEDAIKIVLSSMARK